jgi:hypothetical protein
MHVHCHLHKEEKNDQTKSLGHVNERRNKEETIIEINYIKTQTS